MKKLIPILAVFTVFFLTITSNASAYCHVMPDGVYCCISTENDNLNLRDNRIPDEGFFVDRYDEKAYMEGVLADSIQAYYEPTDCSTASTWFEFYKEDFLKKGDYINLFFSDTDGYQGSDNYDIYIYEKYLVVKNVSSYFENGLEEFGVIGDFNGWDFSKRKGSVSEGNLVVDLESLPLRFGVNRLHIAGGKKGSRDFSLLNVADITGITKDWFHVTDENSKYGAGEEVLAIYYDGVNQYIDNGINKCDEDAEEIDYQSEEIAYYMVPGWMPVMSSGKAEDFDRGDSAVDDVFIFSKYLVIKNISSHFAAGSGKFGVVGDFNNWDFSDRKGYMANDKLIVNLGSLPLKYGYNAIQIIRGGDDYESASWIMPFTFSEDDQEWFWIRKTDYSLNSGKTGPDSKIFVVFYDGVNYFKKIKNPFAFVGIPADLEEPMPIEFFEAADIYFSGDEYDKLVVENISSHFETGSGEFGIIGDFNGWDFSSREGFITGDSLVVDLKDLPLELGVNRLNIVQGEIGSDSFSFISTDSLLGNEWFQCEWFQLTDESSVYGAGEEVLAINYYESLNEFSYDRVYNKSIISPEIMPEPEPNNFSLQGNPETDDIYILSNLLVVENISFYFMFDNNYGRIGVIGDFNGWDFSDRKGYLSEDILTVNLDRLSLEIGVNRIHIVKGGRDTDSALWFSSSCLSDDDREWFRFTDASSEYGAGEEVLAIYYDGTNYFKVDKRIAVLSPGIPSKSDEFLDQGDPEKDSIYVSSNLLIIDNFTYYFLDFDFKDYKRPSISVIGDFNNWNLEYQEAFNVGDSMVLDLDSLPLVYGTNRLYLTREDFLSSPTPEEALAISEPLRTDRLLERDQEWFRITDASSEYGAGEEVLAVYYNGTDYYKTPEDMPVLSHGYNPEAESSIYGDSEIDDFYIISNRFMLKDVLKYFNKEDNLGVVGDFNNWDFSDKRGAVIGRSFVVNLEDLPLEIGVNRLQIAIGEDSSADSYTCPYARVSKEYCYFGTFVSYSSLSKNDREWFRDDVDDIQYGSQDEVIAIYYDGADYYKVPAGTPVLAPGS